MKNIFVREQCEIRIHDHKEKKSGIDVFYDIILFMFIIALVAFVNVRPLFTIIQYIFICLFLFRFIKKDYKLSSYTLWSVIFVLISFGSILVAKNQKYTFAQSISVVQPLIFCNLLIPYMTEKKKNYQFVFNCLIMAAFALLIRVLISSPLYVWGTERMGSSIGYNANTFGLVLAFSSIISYYQYKVVRSNLYLVIFVILGFTSLFSGSRKVIVILMLGVFFISIASAHNFRKLIISIIFAALFFLMLYYIIIKWEPLYHIIGRRVESLLQGIQGNSTDSSTATRFDMIEIGIGFFKQRPLFGYGLGTYRFISNFETYSHNNYIELLVSFGLFGTCVYYSMHLMLLIKGISRLFTEGFANNSAQLTCLVIGIILLMDMGMVSYYDEFFNLLLALAFVSVNQHQFTRRINEQCYCKAKKRA